MFGEPFDSWHQSATQDTDPSELSKFVTILTGQVLACALLETVPSANLLLPAPSELADHVPSQLSVAFQSH